MEGEDKQQHLYKVLVIGDYAVGKTCVCFLNAQPMHLSPVPCSSIIKRYCEGYFTPNYKLTIGVDFAVKVVEWDDSTSVSLQLWDVAGHERFGACKTSGMKEIVADGRNSRDAGG